MSDYKFRINTTPKTDDTIEIETLSINNGIIKRISLEIIDTKESQIREALIQLGWTPPEKRAQNGRT